MTQLNVASDRTIVFPIRQSAVRSAVRFPIRLEVTIHSAWGEIKALTENVSANGLLIVCAFLPEFDGPVEFTMMMPGAVLGTEKDVRIHCRGRIVRRETGFHQTRAAIVIDEYLLKA